MVRILTNDADTESLGFKADLSSSLTDGGGPGYGAQAALNVPIIRNKLALRITGGHLHRGGWLSNDNIEKTEINEADLSNFRTKLLFEPTERLRVRAAFWFQKKQVGSLLTSDENYDRSNLFEEHNDQEFGLYNLALEYRFPKLSIYLTNSYLEQEASLFDGSNIIARSDTEFDQTSFNSEMRLRSLYDGPLNWTGGIFYMNSGLNVLNHLQIFLTGGGMGEIPYLGYHVDSRQAAAFSEVHYRFFDDRFRATIGLRYFDEKLEHEDVLSTTIQRLEVLGLEAKRSAEYEKISPRFNLSFSTGEHSMIYATVANGFRSGSIQDGSFLVTGRLFGLDVPLFVQEEDLWSYELGSKWNVIKNKLFLEGAIYFNNWSDLIVFTNQVIEISGQTLVISYAENAGKATATGIDLNMSFTGSKGLVWSVGGNLNRSLFQEDHPGQIGIKKGDRIYNVPKMTLSGTVSYTFPIFKDKLSGIVYSNLQYSTKRWNYAAGESYSGDDILLLNVRAGVESKFWGLFLTSTNLFQENGVILPAITPTVVPFAVRQAPRILGINLKINL